MPTRLVIKGRTRVFSQIEERAKSLERVVGEAAVRQIRFGPEGVEAQFVSQGEIGQDGSFRPWVTSQRVKRRGGLTLVDTGKYIRAWTGRGPGAIAEVRPSSAGLQVRVGVDPSQFPQVLVFQKDTPTVMPNGARIAQRPVSLNPGTVERIGRIAIRYLGGER